MSGYQWYQCGAWEVSLPVHSSQTFKDKLVETHSHSLLRSEVQLQEKQELLSGPLRPWQQLASRPDPTFLRSQTGLPILTPDPSKTGIFLHTSAVYGSPSSGCKHRSWLCCTSGQKVEHPSVRVVL